MTYPTRGDKGSGYSTDNSVEWETVTSTTEERATVVEFDWLLLLALTLDLGLWVGLLAWWIWR